LRSSCLEVFLRFSCVLGNLGDGAFGFVDELTYLPDELDGDLGIVDILAAVTVPLLFPFLEVGLQVFRGFRSSDP
jgi:hypothetical protein